MSVNTGDTDAECILFDETYGVTFPTISGVEGGGTAINNTYGIPAYPTYILIAPDHSIVIQDIWPIPNVGTFINAFEGQGLVQTDCGSTLTAAFTSDATNVCINGEVSFTDMSVGSITEWNWTFEGGYPDSSTEENPIIAYTTLGSFDVELTVSDGTNTNTIMMEDYITVNDLPEVTLEAFEDVCIQIPAFELTGGMPAGGEYSGPGVSGGMFDPTTAGAGTHTIVYTYMDNNDCENSAEQSILVDPCTGLGELDQQNGLSIFPNPSNGNFSIELMTKGDVTISVTDMLGVTIYQSDFSAYGKFNTSIDLNNAESGMYFVIVQSANEKFVRKLKVVN